jgi:ubiquinone biosynthesis protein
MCGRWGGLPELIRRIDHYYPPLGAAPPGPPLPELGGDEAQWHWRMIATAVIAWALASRPL